MNSTGIINTGSLAGADIFVTGLLQVGATISAAEGAELQNFVSNGGGLLFIGDGSAFSASCSQFATLFNGPNYGGEYNAFGVNLIITDPSHPLIDGPFGVVSLIGGLNVPGRWVNLNASHASIAQNPDTSTGLVAFDYGAGRVVFTNDVNFFFYPPAYTASHATLWDNTIEWLLGGGLSLSVSGACPGSITVEVSGATPNGLVAFAGAVGTGNFVVPGGPCAGTQLGLNGTARLVGTATADAAGELTISRNVGAGACGAFLQAVDASTCGTSNVEQIP